MLWGERNHVSISVLAGLDSGADAGPSPIELLLQAPLFLLWGELDPWITPASADRIQKIFPAAERVNVRGGHCPHDDVPQLFIPPLQRWLEALP